MSMDMIVYIKDFNNITNEDCEKYLIQFGLDTKIHPDTDFKTQTGFLPFRVEFPLIDDLKGKAFISGFEFFSEAYDFQQDLAKVKELQKAPPKKGGGLFGLFKQKNIVPEEIKEDIQCFVVDPDVDNVLKECNYSLLLCSHNMDELIVAMAVTIYLAETGNGVVLNPQTGDYFYKDINQELSEQIKWMFTDLEPETLRPFEGWS